MGYKINHCDWNGTYEDERARSVEVMFQRRRQCLTAGQVLINLSALSQVPRRETFVVHATNTAPAHLR